MNIIKLLPRAVLLCSSWTVSIQGESYKLIKDKRIIGGREAEVGKYPYAVSIQDIMGHGCGGSLISRDVVLSAA